MRTKTVRPFPGPKVDQLPDGFDKWAISEALEPDGLPRTKLTRRSGQDCKWSDHLTEIAKRNGYNCKMEKRSGRVWYSMRQQAA